jgi:tRNA dimethylallyltransferase
MSELESYEGEVWFVGGTGLYLRAVLEGLELGPPPLPELRAWFETSLGSLTSAELARQLGLVVRDPDNPRRVLRALEELAAHPEGRRRITAVCGVELPAEPAAPVVSPSRLDETSVESKVDIVESLGAGKAISQGWACAGIYVLDPGPVELEARIIRRVRGMFEAGLVAEAAQLRAAGFGEIDIVRDGIGYREALAVLDGGLTVPEAIGRTVIRTRQYAKRQRTYFRGRGWQFYTEAELDAAVPSPNTA